MDVREKLVELLKEIVAIQECGFGDPRPTYETVASYLMSHGVTVQDGKPLDAFLHPVDAYKGLKAKYLVFKADTGESVENCFVLRPDKDPAAVEALRAYAKVTDNETLENDIYNWVGNGVMVREWVSVDDRLPEDDLPKDTKKKMIRCLVYTNKGTIKPCVRQRWEVNGKLVPWQWNKDLFANPTHWMYYPQPPKGE